MEFVVAHSEDEACPYLPGQLARMPLRLPLRPVPGQRLDELLEGGDRRAGPFLYRTACTACSACEPLRIPVARFQPTRSQRKVLRRNAGDLQIEVGRPRITPRHLELFNRHKLERGLGTTHSDATDYRLQFLETCVDTREVRYLAGGELVGVSLLDVGERAASSVYHYFDPDESRRSLGVFSVLAEIGLCASWRIDWYYLGLYVAGCRSLRYKAEYFPHERRIGGTWRSFEREDA
ncbi:arginyltransferase [Vulgatibacter sp.]|uniref:arginyltransferase n=1 Tax=Vulgatibacter sp. TaxID=1971226 RepID=UPI0035622FF8